MLRLCNIGSSHSALQTDLTRADVIDSRQTALSGNRKVFLRVQDVFFCAITRGSEQKLAADGT